MNFLSPLFDWHFWFDLTPTRMSPMFESGFFFLFVLALAAGAVLRMMVRNGKYDKYKAIVFKKIAALCSWSGIAGMIWFFFTFEEVQFFGSRFWILIGFVCIAIAKFSIWRYVKKEVPLLKHREQSRSEVNKYLPRRKR